MVWFNGLKNKNKNKKKITGNFHSQVIFFFLKTYKAMILM